MIAGSLTSSKDSIFEWVGIVEQRKDSDLFNICRIMTQHMDKSDIVVRRDDKEFTLSESRRVPLFDNVTQASRVISPVTVIDCSPSKKGL